MTSRAKKKKIQLTIAIINLTTLKFAESMDNIFVRIEIHLRMKITHSLKSNNLFYIPIRRENLGLNIRHIHKCFIVNDYKQATMFFLPNHGCNKNSKRLLPAPPANSKHREQLGPLRSIFRNRRGQSMWGSRPKRLSSLFCQWPKA